MGEAEIHDCFFCAKSGGDRLPHYLQCDTFWTLLISCAGLGTDQLGICPLVRGCYSRPSLTGCNLITCAFLVYHAIKLQHLEVALEGINAGDNVPTLNPVIELALYHFDSIGFGLLHRG